LPAATYIVAANGVYHFREHPDTVWHGTRGILAAYVSEVRVREQGTSRAADLVYRPTASFSGKVIDRASGKPVEGACVYFESPDCPPGRRAGDHIIPRHWVSGPDGEFLSWSGAPGLHRAFAVAPSYRMEADQLVPAPGSEIVSLNLRPGEKRRVRLLVDRRAVASGTVVGRVLDERGRPVRWVDVNMTWAPRVTTWAIPSRPVAESRYPQAGDHGEFRISGLAAEPYEITIGSSTITAFGGRILVEPMRAMPVVGKVIRIPDIVLVPAPVVHGTVRDKATGARIPNIELTRDDDNTIMSLYGQSYFGGVVETDQNGHYAMRVRPGRTTICTFKRGWNGERPVKRAVAMGETKTLDLRIDSSDR
jgi:hypothetical protein